VWSFGGPIEPRPKKGRIHHFGPTFSAAAVADGLIYIPEENGYLQCLDAATGRHFWEYDFKAGVWGSAYCVDNRVIVAPDDGQITVFEQGREMKVLATIDCEGGFDTTPVAANGVLYIASHHTLYAIAHDKKEKGP